MPATTPLSSTSTHPRSADPVVVAAHVTVHAALDPSVVVHKFNPVLPGLPCAVQVRPLQVPVPEGVIQLVNRLGLPIKEDNTSTFPFVTFDVVVIDVEGLEVIAPAAAFDCTKVGPVAAPMAFCLDRRTEVRNPFCCNVVCLDSDRPSPAKVAAVESAISQAAFILECIDRKLAGVDRGVGLAFRLGHEKGSLANTLAATGLTAPKPPVGAGSICPRLQTQAGGHVPSRGIAP